MMCAEEVDILKPVDGTGGDLQTVVTAKSHAKLGDYGKDCIPKQEFSLISETKGSVSLWIPWAGGLKGDQTAVCLQ